MFLFISIKTLLFFTMKVVENRNTELNKETVQIYLPKDTILPLDFCSFTPQEQSLMIQIGYDTFKKTKKEVKENFTDEKKKLLKQELDVIYKKEMDILKNQIKEKEDAMNIMKTSYETIIKMKTESHKKDDEMMILPLRTEPLKNEVHFKKMVCKAFRDFEHFEVVEIDEHFILHFSDFSILVHSYVGDLEPDSKDKLREELSNSKCIFGWFISMDINIEKYDKTNFMFEWLSVPKCICYINSLLKTESPIEIIRNAFFTCQTIFKIMNTEHINECNYLKQNEIRIKTKIQQMIQNNMERDTILSQFRENFEQQDEYIRDILNEEINQIVSSEKVGIISPKTQHPFIGRVLEWWNFHILEEKGSMLRSSIIWTMFKRDNPDLIGEINAIEFKDIIYSFIPEERIVKPRNKAGALEIQNIRWKIDRTMNVSK